MTDGEGNKVMSFKCQLDRQQIPQESERMVYSTNGAIQQAVEEQRRLHQLRFFTGNITGLARATMSIARNQAIRGTCYIDQALCEEYPKQLRRIL